MASRILLDPALTVLIRSERFGFCSFQLIFVRFCSKLGLPLLCCSNISDPNGCGLSKTAHFGSFLKELTKYIFIKHILVHNCDYDFVIISCTLLRYDMEKKRTSFTVRCWSRSPFSDSSSSSHRFCTAASPFNLLRAVVDRYFCGFHDWQFLLAFAFGIFLCKSAKLPFPFQKLIEVLKNTLINSCDRTKGTHPFNRFILSLPKITVLGYPKVAEFCGIVRWNVFRAYISPIIGKGGMGSANVVQFGSPFYALLALRNKAHSCTQWPL